MLSLHCLPNRMERLRIQEANSTLDSRRTDVHVTLSRGQITVSGEFLNCPGPRSAHGQLGAERVAKHVDAAVLKVRTASRPCHQSLNEPLRQRTAVSCRKEPERLSNTGARAGPSSVEALSL
jgi:hypothetical protein